MLVPSCSVCVLSELAVAENALPSQLFRDAILKAQQLHMLAKWPTRSGLAASLCVFKAGGGGASCAFPVPDENTNAAARRELVKRLRFIVIFSSSLPTS